MSRASEKSTLGGGNVSLADNASAQRDFFDSLAPTWREEHTVCQDTICRLLEDMPLRAGNRVLDVACGAGVLGACLRNMGLRVDAIDISPLMIEKAKKNRANDGINFIVADFYEYQSDEKYDGILVFDAYPHFLDKVRFAEKAAKLLREGGTLFIFFDESRQCINAHHKDHSSDISIELKSAAQEAEVYASNFDIICLKDDENGYSIGLKRR